MGHIPAGSSKRSVLSSREAAAALGVCERTLRRYIASDRIRYHRLPGGHYRIPEEAIAEFWAEHDRRKQARHLARASTRCVPYPAEPSTSTIRRQPLGRETEHEYDLSPAHLAQLRARPAADRMNRHRNGGFDE
jgi:excisionase family DNA binding protein